VGGRDLVHISKARDASPTLKELWWNIPPLFEEGYSWIYMVPSKESMKNFPLFEMKVSMNLHVHKSN
jgi:hypothetical protein